MNINMLKEEIIGYRGLYTKYIRLSKQEREADPRLSEQYLTLALKYFDLGETKRHELHEQG
jgi:hypothetical protein